VIGAIPIVYGWLYPPDLARLLIHYDPYTVYDPGKPIGVKIKLGLPPTREFYPLRPTILPEPPIKIVSPDGKEITSPVYDIEVSIWNGGSEPINRDKIRRPVILTFPHVESFLGFRVLHQNPNDGLTIVSNSSSPASLKVSWDYMDPGQGFKIAVVFATTENLAPPTLNSYIVANVIDTNMTFPGFVLEKYNYERQLNYSIRIIYIVFRKEQKISPCRVNNYHHLCRWRCRLCWNLFCTRPRAAVLNRRQCDILDFCVHLRCMSILHNLDGVTKAALPTDEAATMEVPRGRR
jgi:hypothetical protein